VSWPNRREPDGPGTRSWFRRFVDAAAAFTIIFLLSSSGSCLSALPQPRALDAPPLFLPDADGGGWTSVAGSFDVHIQAGLIRVRDSRIALEIQYLGASPLAAAEPEGAAVTPVSIFSGRDPVHWRRNLQGRPSVRVRGLYGGIDLVIRVQGGRLKTDYIVAPGADPGRIRMRYSGASSVRVEPDGGLAVGVPGGQWWEAAPVAWQTSTESVQARFQVDEEGTVGFAVGQYDRTRELVIDPALTLSTLLGGQGTTQANAVAVDGVGDVYVAGYTDATDFPNVSPVRSRSSGVEAWVVKIRPSEARILWATCLGGSGDDRAFALALDPAGGVYVAGWTGSPDFPVASPAQPQLSGGRDAFLLKLNTAGNQIVFSTFHGGTNVESGLALAAYSGGVWIAGGTASTDMPVTGAAKSTLGGVQDGFLARFHDTGARLSSTYFGGSGEEMVRALALDSSGRPYVAGSSESTDFVLPVGVFQRIPAGGRDGFVLRFNTAASAIETGTMLGGTSGSLSTIETISALAVDATNGVVVAGYTPSADFPVVSAWQATRVGDIEGFLTRIAPDFSSLTWSTYVGGINRDTLDGLALDSAGRIYAAGKSMSPDFPLIDPVQAVNGGNLDVVLMRFPASGGVPEFSTFLGGSGADGAVTVSVSTANVAWVAGAAGGLDYPQATPLVTLVQSGVHAFLSGVSFGTAMAPSVVSVTPASGSGTSQSFTLRISDAAGGGYATSANLLLNSSRSGLRACFISYDRSENRFSLNGDPGSAWSSGAPGAAVTLSNRQCDLNLASSAATVSGAYLDLTLHLSFKPAFAGAKLIYAVAANGSGLTTGWVQLGAWAVTGAGNLPPSAMTVSPSAGGGTRQVFTIQFSDPDGDLEEGGFTVGHAPSAPSSCTLAFHRAANRILLAGDDGSTWAEAEPGQATTIANTQCTLRLATSAFSVGSTAWTVTVDLEVNSAWHGNKGLFLFALDGAGNGAGWTAAGSYQAGGSAGRAPGLSAIAPSSGSGGGGLFELSYWDADGSTDISTVTMLINGAHTAADGCMIQADRRYGTIYLAADDGKTWSGGAAGQSTLLQNSQCAVHLATSTFAYSGATLKFRVWVAFKAAFLGAKTIWSHAADQSGRASPPMGWTGTYTVTSALAALVTPLSGTDIARGRLRNGVPPQYAQTPIGLLRRSMGVDKIRTNSRDDARRYRTRCYPKDSAAAPG